MPHEMKVLVFTTAFPNNVWPNHGVFVKERMLGYGRLPGCSVRVVSPVPYFPNIKLGSRWKYSQVRREERIEGTDVSHPRYPVIPKIGMSTHGLAMYLSCLPTVSRIRREFDFDLISAHTVYPDGLAGVLLGKHFGKPVVVSARGTDINLFPKFPVIRRQIQYTLSNADHNISVCQALKDVMVSLGTDTDKIDVVANGIDPEKFQSRDKHAARKTLELGRNRTIILSVGELIPRKGFHLLIRAMAILAREYGRNDLQLVIAGEGTFRAELESLAGSLGQTDSVKLIGSVKHQDLPLWYNAADLFCLASSREGWPNVMVEALACGTPVVATNVWGNSEILHTDKLGLLADEDELSIAKTIDAALSKEWNYDEISAMASKRTWGIVAGEMKEVFDSVVANRDHHDTSPPDTNECSA